MLPTIPIYVEGLILFFAFVLCNVLARRFAKRTSIDPNLMTDLVICLFVCGIIGGRIVFVATKWHNDVGTGFGDRPLWDVVKLWDGGFDVYGATIGAASGFCGYYFFVLRNHIRQPQGDTRALSQ